MKLVTSYLIIGLAGAIGAMSRYAVGSACGWLFGPAFPVGTFVINISGSFFVGWLLGMADSRLISETTRLALGVGFAGAYTTFSTFMYESHALIGDGAGIKATANLLGSLIVGLLAVRFGMALGHR